MKKHQKSILLTLIALILALSSGLTAFAAFPPDYSPQWNNADSVSSSIEFGTGSIQCKVNISGKSGTTFYNGTIVLEKVTGSDTGIVATWTNQSSSTNLFIFDETVYVAPTSGRYKLTINIWTVRNGVTEKINASTSKLY